MNGTSSVDSSNSIGSRSYLQEDSRDRTERDAAGEIDITNAPTKSKGGRENDGDYLDREILPLLLSALKETLREADRQNALRTQKCRFNGLDRIAEILWNRNPKRSGSTAWLDAFDIPRFKVHASSRPYYPKSWLWSAEEATLRIQRYVRGWLVRKRDDVQEMRRFWKVYKGEE